MSLNDKGKSKNKLLGSMGILGVLVLKFKFYIFAAWKGLALFKLSWLLSPLISIGFYAMILGWPFAFAIMLLLFIHEMGHWIWMKALGLEPKPMVFLPGVGAYVAMTKLPPDEATHAWVALAGPLVGGVGSVILYWLGVNSGNNWLIAAGSTGFWLNLLQLVPAKPLDGGFIIQAVSKWFLIPGAALLIVLAMYFRSILLLIIAGISVFSLIKQFRQPKRSHSPAVVRRSVIVGADGKLVSTENLSEPSDASQPPAYSTIDAGSSVMTASGVPISPMPLMKPISPMPLMKPASLTQRITIAGTYLSLVVMLSYLYWLSHNELISVIPQH